jgi:D-alanyl-D-alanine carboxypeptidase
MRRLLLCTGLLMALGACGGDDNAPPPLPAATQAAVDDIVQTRLAADNLPGAVVLISIPGEGEMVKAYGKANLQTQAPRTTTDPFRIASITKTFIGTLILQLVDDGRLALSDPVSKWYPSFPNGNAITIDHLLRMRSGIADSLDEGFLQELYADPAVTPTQQQLIDRAAARASEFVPPDTVTRYTNINFVLLDEIAARVAGEDIRTLLQRRIYAPLGMTHTVYPQASELGGANRGYLFNPGTGRFEDLTVVNPTGAGGAGALISTLADLKLYARALCTGSLLKPQTHARRLQGSTLDGEPAFVQYGAGVLKLGRFCGHNGTVFGFSSEMFYLPERDAVVIVNVNRLDLDDHSQSTELFLLLTKELFPQDVDW